MLHVQLDQSIGSFRLRHIEFSVERGEVVGILGPNGSGKSSVLDHLTNWRQPDVASVFYDGRDIRSMAPLERARTVAQLSQRRHEPFQQTVEQLCSVALYATPRDVDRSERIEQTLHTFQLSSLRYRFLDELSGGERQRAYIAQLACRQTPYVLLDEPTSYLDEAYKQFVFRTVRHWATAGRKGVVLVLHDFNEAIAHCDRVIVLSNGEQVGKGDPEDVLTPSFIRTHFRADVVTVKHPISGRNFVLPL